MSDSLDKAIAGLDSLLRTASGNTVKAEFWVTLERVNNVSVRDFESPDLGTSGRSGIAVVAGTMHVKPVRYTWTMDVPFQKRIRIAEDPRSGTLAFSSVDKSDGQAHMVVTAIHEDSRLETQVMKMLGRVPFVPYED